MRTEIKLAALVGATLMASVASTQAQQVETIMVLPTVTSQSYQPNYSAWDGFYAGAQIGLVATKTHEIGGVVGPEQLMGDMGGAAGLFAGYRYQINDWLVLGVDGEFNNISTEYLYTATKYGALTWDAAVRATLGYPVAHNVLAYGTVGYSWAGIDLSPGYADPDAKFTGGGIQLGVGVDMLVTENVMARLNATWAHYGVHTVPVPGGGTSEPSAVTVRVGLGWKF